MTGASRIRCPRCGNGAALTLDVFGIAGAVCAKCGHHFRVIFGGGR